MDKKQRFIQLAILTFSTASLPAAWEPYQPMSILDKGRCVEYQCRQDNEATVALPVVRPSVDVVSLSFKLQLIALFRRCSVWLLAGKG